MRKQLLRKSWSDGDLLQARTNTCEEAWRRESSLQCTLEYVGRKNDGSENSAREKFAEDVIARQATSSIGTQVDTWS